MCTLYTMDREERGEGVYIWGPLLHLGSYYYTRHAFLSIRFPWDGLSVNAGCTCYYVYCIHAFECIRCIMNPKSYWDQTLKNRPHVRIFSFIYIHTKTLLLLLPSWAQKRVSPWFHAITRGTYEYASTCSDPRTHSLNEDISASGGECIYKHVKMEHPVLYTYS